MRRRRGLAACASLSLFALTATLTRPALAQDLAPPPPMSPPSSTPAYEDTSYRLDEAERKDSGRNFEIFWADPSVGGSYINMSQFSSDALQVKKADSAGPAFSMGLGARFVILVVGARVRYNALSAFNMW